MNYNLMRISLVVAVIVNILVLGTFIYQNRSTIQADDPRLPTIVAQLERGYEKKLSEYDAQLKTLEKRLSDEVKDNAHKAQATFNDISAQVKAYAERSDKFEAAGKKTDEAVQSITAQLKKLVK